MPVIDPTWPVPSPNFQRFLAVLRRERPDRVPLVELAVHPTVVAELLGEPLADLPATQVVARTIRVLHRLGYDVAKVSAAIPWGVRRQTSAGAGPAARQWTDEQGGPIATRADFEAFAWPAPGDVDFAPVDAAVAALPAGMGLLGFSGGVLEFAMDLLGMQRLMVLSRKAPDLVRDVVQRVGAVIYAVFEEYCRRPAVCAVWLGDDLGHKHGPLLAPGWLREHILPWYARFAALAHAHGRPFLLHSCGDTQALTADFIAAGVDAKHSFEDGITPVEQFIAEWGGRIAVLGGVDVHLLATATPAEVRTRTRQILASAAPRGGYAAGSGNSIPDYVPVENYLALVRAVHEFNAECAPAVG